MSDILSRLGPPAGARTAPRRVGRGVGSGLGKTAGRGQKGDRARGGSPRRGFEGGQMPLFRRVPKRGFNPPHPVVHHVVNLKDLARCFEPGAVVDPDTLRVARLVRGRGPVKILAQGEIDRALTVRVHAASKTAVERIRAAGGQVEILGADPADEAKEGTE